MQPTSLTQIVLVLMAFLFAKLVVNVHEHNQREIAALEALSYGNIPDVEFEGFSESPERGEDPLSPADAVHREMDAAAMEVKKKNSSSAETARSRPIIKAGAGFPAESLPLPMPGTR